MNTTIEKTVTTLNGLLRVGMLDEAMEIGRRELRAHGRNPQLVESLARVLESKLEGVCVNELPDVEAFIEELRLPGSHSLHARLPDVAARIKGGADLDELLAQGEALLRRKEPARALELLREARSRRPDHRKVARSSGIAILRQLRRLSPQGSDENEQAKSLLREYMLEVAPYVKMPSRLHSHLMAQMIRFPWGDPEPLHLVKSILSWPAVFWTEADTVYMDKLNGSRLVAIFELAMNYITFEKIRLQEEESVCDPDMSVWRKRLTEKINLTAKYVNDEGSLISHIWMMKMQENNFSDGPEVLRSFLLRHPKCIRGWQLLEGMASIAKNRALAISATCQAVLLAPPHTRVAGYLHQKLGDLFAEEGWDSEARLEFLLSRQNKPMPKGPDLPFLDPVAEVEIQPYGYRVGEGNYDLYQREAKRVWNRIQHPAHGE